jgi:hypothetical protein
MRGWPKAMLLYPVVIRRLGAKAEPEADIWQNAKVSLPAQDTANMAERR